MCVILSFRRQTSASKYIAVLVSALLTLGSAVPSCAQPAIVPDAPVMNLDELGVYAVGYAYRGQPEQQFPLGWSGYFEDRTGVACQPAGTQNGKRAFLLHCPWRGGTGIAFQQFAFSLPASPSRILLRGATAMRSDILTNSDGVTFRVYTNGIKALDYHQTNDVWREFQFDCTALRGSNLTVRFETDPGPRNNPSFDFSLWGARELVLEGYTPPVITHPAPPPLALSNVWSRQSGEVAPPGGFAGTTNVSIAGDIVRFRYAGPDGTLEYQWARPQSATDGLFGTLTLAAQMAGDAPVTVPLANSASLTWTSTATAGSSSWVQTNLGFTLLRNFTVAGTNATVRITGRIVGKSLVFSVACDQPRVSAFDIGAWGPVVRRRQVVTPFYTGAAYFLPNENLFVNAFLDWTASSASSHSGSKANYGALTDGTRNRLGERVVFSAAWHLAEVLPNLPNPPSPWLDFLANKVVLDNWGGQFTNIANNLTNLADYGVTNCVALIHDWQRSGYDNALPAHYPANASYGGDAGMSNLVATGLRLGIRCALHENYVDYYPNYDFYNTNDIALDSAGKLQLAWFNPGTGIQSFAVKPNAILPLAATQSPEIHRRYGTKANYLDVHSAVPPWFHVDFRAGEPGAGTFDRVWDVHRELWAYERVTHEGPVFGEGNNHWYWSGCLDGVEAQFGSGWPGNGGFTAPLNVDFDLLKIHPLQFNHGMGYYERWWPKDYETNWAGPPPMVVLDQYRMQEVAYGHAGFLAGSVYANIPIAWLEHHLLSPVMAGYATAKPVEILYENGDAWLDASATAKLESGGTNNRVRVRYDNGLTLTANSAPNTLVVGPWTLPQFGWVAEGAGIRAGTVLRDDVVTDFADAGDTLFVNARPAADWNVSSFRRVHPSVASFQQTAARTFRVTYRWDVQDRLAKDYRCFVHFCTNGAIRWQQDHSVAPPTSQWLVGQTLNDGPWTVTISTNIPDGDYDWLIGLFDAAGDWSRVRLLGVDDGSSRIRLGVLHVQTNGTSITFTPETGIGTDPTPIYRVHLNEAGKLIDFGGVRTDGSAWLRREGNGWVLKTWPRDRNFTLELNAKRFDQPARVQSPGGATSEVAPVPAGPRWRLPLNGAREYRWTNDGFRASSLVPTGAVWKYLDNGTDQGAAWQAPGFDDSAWAMGPAQLGYGDLDEATLIGFGSDPNNVYITTYFRSKFVVTNATSFADATVRLLRDDGGIVYLNGVEVFRSNMTNGPVSFLTPAFTVAGQPDESTFFPAAVSPGLLVNGTNVLAVEIHQAGRVSADLSFDLELIATVNEPPSVELTSPPDGLVAAASELILAASATDPEDAVESVEFFADGVLVAADVRRLTSDSSVVMPRASLQNEPPYVGCYGAVWSNPPAGDHVLIARVTDIGGRSADSAPVHVTLASPAAALVNAGAVWRYNDAGTDLGPAWRAPGYDDSTWPSGPAQLGYGDYDEATVISYGTNLFYKNITTYFRRAFVAPDPTNFATLLLRVLRDDGAVVYLNDAQVWRNNISSEPLAYHTLADSSVSGGDESTNFYAVTVNPALLTGGPNVLAVEVHQSSPESSDLSFDLELLGFPPGALPRLAIARTDDAVVLSWPTWATGFALHAAALVASPAAWSAVTNAVFATNGEFNTMVSTGASQRFFQLRRR
jgi:hypothetical protein